MMTAPDRGAGKQADKEKPRRGKAPGLKKSVSISNPECSAPAPKNQAPGRVCRSHKGVTVGSFVLYELRTGIGKERTPRSPKSADLVIAKKRITGIRKLIAYRHGRSGKIPDHLAQAYFIAVAPQIRIAAALDSTFTLTPFYWARRRLPDLSQDFTAEAMTDICRFPPWYTSEEMGRLLGLLDVERDATRFWHAAAIDMTPEDRAAKERAKDAAYQREKRRAAGARPAHLAINRTVERRDGEPLSSFYRRAKREREASHG